MEKHYKLLGLEITATLKEVEKRFNILCKEYDPEKQTDDELKEFFKKEQNKIQEAYNEICLHIIREKEEEKKRKDEEQTTIEDKVVEEVTEEKVREEKDEEEYRKTIHDNKNDASDLKITYKSKEGLDKMVYWSKFLAIAGYIILGIASLGVIRLIISYQDLPSGSYNYYGRYYYTNYHQEELFQQIMLSIISIIMWFFPVRYLDRFSSKTRISLTNNDELELEEGLENLGSFFKFYGVIMILVLAIIAFLFLTRI